jgi:hypothetical protein
VSVARPDTDERHVFRGRYSLTVNVLSSAAGTILFVVLIASTIADPPENGSGSGGTIVAAIGMIGLACLLVRSTRASMLVLGQDELVYRTLLRNRRIARTQVIGARIEKGGLSRGGGLIKAWIPVLDLADGSSLLLTEMKAGIQSSIDFPDTYNDYTHHMMKVIHEWVILPGSQSH